MGGRISRAPSPPPAVRFLPSLGTRATDVAFSPDGRWLAAHGRSHTCAVYDLDTGELAHSLAHERQLWGAPTFSADGALLLTSGFDGARLWELPSGRAITRSPAAQLVDATLVGSERAVTVHKDGTIETCAIHDTWRSLARVATGVPSTCHTVSPDGRYVLVIGHTPVVGVVWDVPNHGEVMRLDDDAIGWAAFGGPECRFLATIRSFVGQRPPHPLWIRELPRKKPVQRSRDTALCAAIADDGTRYAYATGTHVALCDGYGKELEQFEIGIQCAAVAFDRAGRQLAAASQNGGVTVFTL
jgi:hypothetical protein